MSEKIDEMISEMRSYVYKHENITSQNSISKILANMNKELCDFGLLTNKPIIDFRKTKKYLSEYDGLEEFTLKLFKLYICLNDKLDEYEQIVEKAETICDIINQYRKLKTIAGLDDIKVNKFTIVDDLNKITSTVENSLTEKNLRIAELEDEVSRLKWRCENPENRLELK